MTGRDLRLGRLFDRDSDTTVMIAHSNALYFGPSAGLQTNSDCRRVLQGCLDGGADAVMVTPGALRSGIDLLCGRNRPAIVLSIGYTHTWRPVERLGRGMQGGDQAIFASVEEAVRLGADALHVYVFLGWHDDAHEVREIERLGRICEEARKWGIPVMCEPLARGDAVQPDQFNSIENVALMARIASEVGADIVKVEYTGSAESFKQVIDASSVPVVMMGGAKNDTFEGFLASLEGAAAIGAKGVAVGRNIYSHPDPAAAVAGVVEAVRNGAAVWKSKK